MYRNTLVACTAVAALLFTSSSAFAKEPAKKPNAKSAPAPEVQEVVVNIKPPTGNWEATPKPARGYVWSAGYYEWKDNRFQWKRGDWVPEKEGMDYRQYQWVSAGEGKWKLVGGDWVPGKAGASN